MLTAGPLAHSMKQLHTISLLLFLLSINLSGQIKGTVTDKSSGLPIQYANVFLHGKPIGATTSLDGSFEIKQATPDDILIISAIGYESQQILATNEIKTIHLVPKTYELSGVIVKPKKYKSELRIGTYDKNKIHDYFICNGFPWIVTKYFEFKQDYKANPYLKQIKILTSLTSLDSAIFNLRLLSLNHDGSPGNDLINKNLIVKALPGRNNNTIINLTPYNLTFPETGLVVAVEWLVIDQNRAEYKSQIQYLPQFGSVTNEGEVKSWNYIGGKWIKSSFMPPSEKNKYKELAAELTLTN
jgi:hypothetical protein